MGKISAILLAAGKSERMGGPNKLLLTIHDEPMIAVTYQNLCSSHVYEIIVVTGRDADEVNSTLSLRDKDQLVHNENYQLGMTTSIQKGVEQATGDAYMICLGDMPWLSATHYNSLMDQFHQSLEHSAGQMLLPKVNGKRGNPVIFSNEYREEILSHKEPEGCRGILKAHPEKVSIWNTPEVAFVRDVDTPEDYKNNSQ